jgi:hypothetical protein
MPVYMHVLTLRVPDEMLAQIKAALAPGQSIAAWLRDAAVEKMAREGGREAKK